MMDTCLICECLLMELISTGSNMSLSYLVGCWTSVIPPESVEVEDLPSYLGNNISFGGCDRFVKKK